MCALLNFVLSSRQQRIYRIPEEQSPGTVVANITAKDPDDEDSPSRLFYSIQSSDKYFSINPCKKDKQKCAFGHTRKESGYFGKNVFALVLN